MQHELQQTTGGLPFIQSSIDIVLFNIVEPL